MRDFLLQETNQKIGTTPNTPQETPYTSLGATDHDTGSWNAESAHIMRKKSHER